MIGRWSCWALRLVTVVGLLVVGLTGLSSPASASQTPLVFHLKFHQVSVAHRVSAMQTSENYALLTLAHGRHVVINDRTGAEREIRQGPGCDVVDMADPWVLFGFCTHQRLYNLRTGASIRHRWISAANIVSPLILGSHWLWIQYPEDCGTGGPQNCHLPAFFSLPSGAENDWQPQGDMFGNVNSPPLKQRLCWPVNQPYRSGIIGPFSSFIAPESSTLVWGNRFIVSISASSDGTTNTYELEGCEGRPTVTMFTSSNRTAWLMASNPHAVTWWLHGSTGHGIFIPSLRRFKVQLPRRLPFEIDWTAPRPLQLTSGHMWLLDDSGRVWQANFPTGP